MGIVVKWSLDSGLLVTEIYPLCDVYFSYRMKKIAECDVFTCATARLCLLKEFCVSFRISLRLFFQNVTQFSVIKIH
jgi:hypothetical protein